MRPVYGHKGNGRVHEWRQAERSSVISRRVARCLHADNHRLYWKLESSVLLLLSAATQGASWLEKENQ